MTVSCAEGDTGHVYDGPARRSRSSTSRSTSMPPSPTKIMMNVGNPELAFEFRRLPNEGVGLARLEFIINTNVGIHPKALLELDRQPAELQREISRAHRRLREPDRVLRRSKIVEGVATIAAAFWPKKVIVRLSDFKSNEYSNLLGGERYEPHEENPMLGLPRRVALHRAGVPRLLRARMRGDEARARRHGAHQRRADDPVRAHAGRGASR